MTKVVFVRGLPSSGKTISSRLISKSLKLPIINPDLLVNDINFKKYRSENSTERLKRVKYLYCLKIASKYVNKNIGFIWDQPWRNLNGLNKTLNLIVKINQSTKFFIVDIVSQDIDFLWNRIKRNKYKKIQFNNKNIFLKYYNSHESLDETKLSKGKIISISDYFDPYDIKNLPF